MVVWRVISVLILVSTVSIQAAPLPRLRRVNMPYFNGQIQYDQMAIFWLGRVTPTENYADVRVGYNDDELDVNVAIFDRRLWYEASPSVTDLTAWDSVTLYLDTDGALGAWPSANSYRFDGQLTWWEKPRTAWQTAYRGNGNSWASAGIPFTTTAGWRGDAPNSQGDDRGWVISFRIPFSSLHLSNPPAPGVLWGMAIVVHDRDDVATMPLPDTVWPEAIDPTRPMTWGQLAFGLPIYTPNPAVPHAPMAIRNKLNGTIVTDGAVGGGTICGSGAAPDYFPQWGSLNSAHATYFNVQNEEDISDWPCFSKYFVTFPLNSVPPGNVIISATLTLYQFGNAGQGWNPGTQPSYLQVLTIDHDWDANTLTWNTAPVARENVAGTWVGPLEQYPGYPGVPRTWDVGRAVAEAYAVGEPVRLAVYSGDGAYHSGRYFHSSDVEDYNAQGRPTLTVVWGEPLAMVQQAAWPLTVKTQQTMTYTLSMLGSGRALTLTDDLPGEVSVPSVIQVQGGGAMSFDQTLRRLTWHGTPAPGQPITITLPVTVLVSNPTAIVNRAVLTDALLFTSAASTIVLANPHQTWLSLLIK